MSYGNNVHIKIINAQQAETTHSYNNKGKIVEDKCSRVV